MAKTNFLSVDEYIAACPAQAQSCVQKIREAGEAVVPKARAKISTHTGAFELTGRNLIGFPGWSSHVSIYPIPAGDKAFNAQVSKYADGKGTLKFPLDEPLPLELIRQIVKFRAADVLKNAGKKK